MIIEDCPYEQCPERDKQGHCDLEQCVVSSDRLVTWRREIEGEFYKDDYGQ